MNQPSDLPSLPGLDSIQDVSKRESFLLQTLYESFAPVVYRKILQAVKDPDRARTVLEKTFMYAVRRIDQHLPSLRLYIWFLQIARFKILEEAAAVTIGIGFPEDCHFDRYTHSWVSLEEEEKEISLEQVQVSITTAIAHFHDLLSRTPENR
ncbi:MAG: hypothetical protein P4L51_03950 [Puia sp.]|nr:hypothetical protein [Puia sp.]